MNDKPRATVAGPEKRDLNGKNKLMKNPRPRNEREL
jgi:hypothetical protein